jgi:hypothetical protein
MNAKARPPAAKHRTFAGISRVLHVAFDADGECRVSGNFRVWFRNGGCEGSMPAVAPAARQSKIYGESKQSDFSLIFADLSSMQSLAIYRRLLVENHCGDRSQRVRKETGREMFFLLRMAFWLGLVLVLLPREKTPESDKLPQIGASDAVQAATAAVSDVSQFCKRQPAACEVGGQAATVIGQRAQEGARKLYQIITDKKSPDHTGSIGGNADVEPAPLELAPRDTLTADDLALEWHAPPTP